LRILLLDRIGSFTGPLLHHWRDAGHEVTFCREAGAALRLLEDGGADRFDLVFLEWCDQAAAAVTASAPLGSSGPPVLLRLRSYERYTIWPRRVNWGVVDRVVFVHDHVLRDALDKHPCIPRQRCRVVHNGVDLTRFSFRDREVGAAPTVGWLGRVAPTKNVPLAFAVLDALRRRHPEAELRIAGPCQSGELYDYVAAQVASREGGARYDGEVADVDGWLKGVEVLLSTSVREGVPNAVLEAMAKGIKPVVHAWPGAESVFGPQQVWNTVDQAVDLITSEPEPRRYRRFVEEGYSLQKHKAEMDALAAEVCA